MNFFSKRVCEGFNLRINMHWETQFLFAMSMKFDRIFCFQISCEMNSMTEAKEDMDRSLLH